MSTEVNNSILLMGLTKKKKIGEASNLVGIKKTFLLDQNIFCIVINFRLAL